MKLVTHLMKKKVSTEKAPLFIVWNRNSFSTTFLYSMLSVITCFVISIVHLSVGNFGINFTFMWPCCIVTNFFVIKPTRCTNFTNLFCHENLHVLDSSDSFRAGPSWPCSKAVYKPVWHIPLLSVQWINPWWWTDGLSETCRVSWQNKFVKLVHLVGFITKKSGTNVNETICILLQIWHITHRDMKFAVCFYQCVRQPQLLNYCGSVALQCVWMWFQSLFIITWANFASYLNYYSFLKVLSTMYCDTDQEINLILGNEWILWQVSTLNQNPFLSLRRP